MLADLMPNGSSRVTVVASQSVGLTTSTCPESSEVYKVNWTVS